MSDLLQWLLRERDEARADAARLRKFLADHPFPMKVDDALKRAEQAEQERDEARAEIDLLRARVEDYHRSLVTQSALLHTTSNERDAELKRRLKEAEAPKTCGTCADAKKAEQTAKLFHCTSVESYCARDYSDLWSADHGCPHWRAKERQ